jgi:hypothetical protein
MYRRGVDCDKSVGDLSPTAAEQVRTIQFECVFCCATFSRQGHLDRHLIRREYLRHVRMWPLVDLATDYGKTDFSCVFCTKKFGRV